MRRIIAIMAKKESRISKIVEYNDGKFWFHKKNNVITVGITHDALDTLGEAESISLPSEGDDFNKDDIVCEISGGGREIKITLPASGFISEVNESLLEDITILNEDPIDEGWLVKLEFEDDSELAEFM